MTRWFTKAVVVTRHQVAHSPVRALDVDHACLKTFRTPTQDAAVVVSALVRWVIRTTLPAAQLSDPNSWSLAMADPTIRVADSKLATGRQQAAEPT